MVSESEAQEAISTILEYIEGDGTGREGLQNTPSRVVNSWKEIFAGYRQIPAEVLESTFNAEGYDGIVLLRDIEFHSTCEHHLQPFTGRAHVAYIPVNQIDNILDVGSGRGYSAVYLSNNNSITATDFSFTQIKKNPVQNKIVCTSEKLPYGDESFSLVNEWELLHHLPDPIKAVNEMSRVAKDYLVLFEPNRQNPGQFCF